MTAGADQSTTVSDRYQRQQMIDWLSRDRLKAQRVLVIGAGAVGNEVIKNLTLLGVGQIDIIDFDRIEIHNLTRSVLFRESDVGCDKAVVAASRAREINPDVKLTAIVGDLWNELNVSSTAAYDTLFACVDNFEARMRASLLCRLAAVDFVTAGIDSRYVSVQRHPFSVLEHIEHNGAETVTAVACYECDLPMSVYQTVEQRYSCGWLRKAGEQQNLVPTTAITASIAGAQAVSLALVTPNDRQAADAQFASRVLIDTRNGQATTSRLPVNGECFACAMLSAQVRRQSFNGSLRSLKQLRTGDGEISENDLQVQFSEALVLDARCVNDERHTKSLQSSTRLTAARNHSEAITWCSFCADSSIDIDIAESLPVSQWQQRFDGASVGCQFILVRVEGETLDVYDNDSVAPSRLDSQKEEML